MKKNKIAIIWILIFISIIGLGAVSFFVGAQDLTLNDIGSYINGNLEQTKTIIINEIRLPRTIVAIIAGANLSIAGLLMQKITRNNIASPGVVGVVDGSVFMVTLIGVMFPQFGGRYSFVASLIGAALAVLIVFYIASKVKDGFSKTKLAIIGITFSTFVSSLSTIVAMKGNKLQDVSQFFLGGVSFANRTDALVVVLGLLIALPIVIYISNYLYVFGVSDDALVGIGINPKKIRIISLIAILILSATSISAIGKVLFIGLIAPNIANILHKNNQKHIVVTAGLIGSLLTILSDLVSKIVNYPFETPLSVVVTVIGIPYFFFLILRKDDKGHE